MWGNRILRQQQQQSWCSLVEKGQKLWVEIPRPSLVLFPRLPLFLIPGTPPESRERRTRRLRKRNEHSVSLQFPIHAHQLTELSQSIQFCYHVTHCHGTLKRRENFSAPKLPIKVKQHLFQMWTNTLNIYVIIPKKKEYSLHLKVVLFFKLECLLHVPPLRIGTFLPLPLP